MALTVRQLEVIRAVSLHGSVTEAAAALRKQVQEHEARVAKLTADQSAIDLAMFDPKQAEPKLAQLAMGDLMKRRADVAAALEQAEAQWMEASEKLETVA
jgi:ATP-binding cassette subfamily F protein 3